MSGGEWNRDLRIDIATLIALHTDLVVSLTETDEMERLRVPDLGTQLQDAGIAWMHLPIPDVGTPDPTWDTTWEQALPRLRNVLEHGGRIVIHCKAGLERTALVAALLQCESGEQLDTALATIARTRSGASPIPNQLRWLQQRLADGGRSQ